MVFVYYGPKYDQQHIQHLINGPKYDQQHIQHLIKRVTPFFLVYTAHVTELISFKSRHGHINDII